MSSVKSINNGLQVAMACLLFASVSTFANGPFSEAQLTDFCENKPIWAAFAIESDACRQAVEHCVAKPEFQTIDPVILSEPFYLCVFKQLNIEL